LLSVWGDCYPPFEVGGSLDPILTHPKRQEPRFIQAGTAFFAVETVSPAAR
jgi:hypothetical protein